MRRRNPNQIVLLLVIDVTLTLVALYLASLARLHLPLGVALTPKFVALPWGIYLMAGLVWLAVAVAFSIYSPGQTYAHFEETKAITGAVVFGNLAFAGLLYMTYRDLPRLLFLYSGLLQGSFIIGVRLVVYLVRRLYRRNHDSRRVLIIGAGKVGQQLAQHITATDDLSLVGYLDDDPRKHQHVIEQAMVLGETASAAKMVQKHKIDEVLIALPLRAHKHLESLVLALQEMPVRVRVVPDIFDLSISRATIEDFGGIPLVGLRDSAIDDVNRVVKRLFDLIVGSIGIVLAAPLMLIVAIAIRLDSPGPAIFKQQRVGENGKLFKIYKFRSMFMDAEAHQHSAMQARGEDAIHKRPDDPRITRIGRFLRRTSIDELPQLFNVLKGEMSLVGPRPELPWLVDQYEIWQRKRFAVPPGITGWWQINGRSDRPMHLNTDDDLYYIQNYSPLMDLRILWRTIGTVLRGKGAY